MTKRHNVVIKRCPFASKGFCNGHIRADEPVKVVGKAIIHLACFRKAYQQPTAPKEGEK